MDINSINKRHFKKYSNYYAVEFGVSARLLQYSNCVLYLEVIVGPKWSTPAYKTALEIAKHWKNTHHELREAIGAKIFIANIHNEEDDSNTYIKIKYKKGILFNFWNKN